MNRVSKVLIGISALAGLWALNLAYEVFPRVSAEQARAVALLSEPSQMGLRNGWSAALALAERPEFAERGEETCGANDDCLAMVIADLPAMRQRALDAAAMIVLQKTMYAYDHWALADTDDFMFRAQSQPFRFNELLTAIATQAASGDVEAATREVCEFSRFSRSLTRTNSLILLMLGDAYLTRSMRMMTELQSRYPVAPDAQCMQAFAPLDTNQQLCKAIKGEFMFNHQVIHDLEFEGGAHYPGNTSGNGSWLSRLSFNAKHSEALIAGALIQYCPQSQRQKAVQSCSWIENVLDPIGCKLFQMGQADYAPYQNRLTDLQQKLALFRLSQFARSTEAQACTERLDCGPEGALAGLIHDSAKGTISVTLLQPRTDQPKEWALALR